VSFKHQESEFVLQALASYYATTGNYKWSNFFSYSVDSL
jgi:hypothetical protein